MCKCFNNYLLQDVDINKGSLAVFYTRGRIMRLDELGQTFVIRLVIRVSSVKTGTRRIICPDELSSFARLQRRTT